MRAELSLYASAHHLRSRFEFRQYPLKRCESLCDLVRSLDQRQTAPWKSSHVPPLPAPSIATPPFVHPDSHWHRNQSECLTQQRRQKHVGRCTAKHPTI